MNGENRNEGGNRNGNGNATTTRIVVLLIVILAIGGIIAGSRRLTRPAPVRPRPAPTRPAPVRPTPTRPAPAPVRPAPTRPAPTTPAPTPADLKRDIDRVKAAVDKNDWTRARDEASTLRRTWAAYRGKAGNLVKSADLTAFESKVNKLIGDVGLKNKSMVDKDLSDLRKLADKFEAARTKAPPTAPAPGTSRR